MKTKNYTSPKGEAIWPKITKPETKWDADGVYETGLRLDAETGQKFKAYLEEFLDKHHDNVCKEQGKKVKKGSFSVKEVEVDGTLTGELDFKFKMKRLAGPSGRQWEQRPAIFDKMGNRIDPESINIGSGSTIKVSYSIFPYYTAMVGAGISLQMKAVQIINLVEFHGGDAQGFGFTEEEGDFVSSQESSDEFTLSEDSDF
tara:strand:- start:885 stop:1487 length:603 start_codon:yes stop_codon:yes gene_type:complete